MCEHSTILLALELSPAAGILPYVLLAMQADSIPSVSEDGAKVRVMAGQHNDTVGPIKMRNPGLLMDVTVQKGGKFVQEVGVWISAVNQGGLLAAACGNESPMLCDCQRTSGRLHWPRARHATPALSIPARRKAGTSTASCIVVFQVERFAILQCKSLPSCLHSAPLRPVCVGTLCLLFILPGCLPAEPPALQIPEEWTAFAYVAQGSGKLSGTRGSAEQALVFGKGNLVEATTEDAAGLRFLLIAGKPMNEPIVQVGTKLSGSQGVCVQHHSNSVHAAASQRGTRHPVMSCHPPLLFRQLGGFSAVMILPRSQLRMAAALVHPTRKVLVNSG